MPDSGLTVGIIHGADREIDRPFSLSRRQRQVLMLAARRRLKAMNTTQAVAIALQNYLISTDMEVHNGVST